MMNEFSVLIAAYSGDNPLWLKEALDSLFGQALPPAQTVLVCDGPLTPALDKVLLQYEDKLDIVRMKQGKGLGAALSEGLEHCKYPLVARMDSDDISLPRRFELQLKRFEREPQLSVLGGAIEEIDARTKESVSFRFLPKEDAQIKKFLKFRTPFNHVTVMFKKEAVLAAGGYKPFHFLEDYYLWGRMAAGENKMANLDEVLVKVRIGKDMFERRGGLKYFKSNKALYDELLKMGLLTRCEYFYILAVRFCVQVLMPSKLRALFYKRVLR